MPSLCEIEEEVNRLAATIGASENDLPDFDGKFLADLRPNVRVDAAGYHYIISERGQEFSHVITRDADELLYLIFKDVVFTVATRYELAHHVAGQDSRRIWFAKEVELLARLQPAWSEAIRQHQQNVLKKHPFDDLALERATLTGHYRKLGCSNEDAWTLACKTYPLLRG